MPRPSIPNEEKNTNFFSRASATKSLCYAKALSLAPGPIVPVPSRGCHSYTLYASPSQDQIVQFRLASCFIDLDTQFLAEQTYGDFVPHVSFEGELGEDDEDGGKEPVCVYLMKRIPGVGRFDFMSKLRTLPTGIELLEANGVFAEDIARFLARGWKSPQPIRSDQRDEMKEKYFQDLQTLRKTLPAHFQPVIEVCISSLDDILSLPHVLQHADLCDTNILVEPESGKIIGVLDWSDAQVLPFGLNLHAVEAFTVHLNLDPEGLESSDHKAMQTVFWETLGKEVGSLSEEAIRTMKKASALGVLMGWGFAGEGEERKVVDLGNTKKGSGMWWLERLLVRDETCFDVGI